MKKVFKKLFLVAILIASPLMGQDNSTTPKKPFIKSIFSINYTAGVDRMLDKEFFAFEDDLQLQMGTSLEYIIGKKWHVYLSLGSMDISDATGYFMGGFGSSLLDRRNAQGSGLMFDWNILTLGMESSKDYNRYTIGTNFRLRYMIKRKFGLQVGLDTLLYTPTSIFDEWSELSKLDYEAYYGFNVGLSFGG